LDECDWLAVLVSVLSERTRCDKASEGKKLSEREKVTGDRERLIAVEVAESSCAD